MENNKNTSSCKLFGINNLSLSTPTINNYQWAFLATQEYIDHHKYINNFHIIEDNGQYMIQCDDNSYLTINTTNTNEYQYAFFATQQYIDDHPNYTNKFTIIEEACENYIVFTNGNTYLYLAYNYYDNYNWNWVIFANENFFKKNKNYATQFIKK